MSLLSSDRAQMLIPRGTLIALREWLNVNMACFRYLDSHNCTDNQLRALWMCPQLLFFCFNDLSCEPSKQGASAALSL